MGTTVKLSDDLINDAIINGKAQQRSTPKQIEYWAKLGKIADENPELAMNFIKGILIGLEEIKANDVSDYKFG